MVDAYFYSHRDHSPLPTGPSLLMDFLSMSTTASQPRGIRQCQEMLVSLLSPYGFLAKWSESEHDKDKNLLVLEKVGTRPSFITLFCHADTVEISQRFRTPQFLSPTILEASGAIDNKGGMVIGGLALIKFLLKHPHHELGLRLICSPSEEQGSPGLGGIFRELSKSSVCLLGLEPAQEGNLIDSRSGNSWYQIKIKGLAAHAGRKGAPSINAAHCASTLIEEFMRLKKRLPECNLNVGSISTRQQTFNIICDDCLIKLDTRFETLEAKKNLENELRNLFSTVGHVCLVTGKKSQIYYSIEDECPPLEKSMDENLLAPYFEAVFQSEKRRFRTIPSGGASDLNYAVIPGVPTIDGLGAVGGKMHTAEEWIYLPSLESRSDALASWLQHLQLSFTKVIQ